MLRYCQYQPAHASNIAGCAIALMVYHLSMISLDAAQRRMSLGGGDFATRRFERGFDSAMMAIYFSLRHCRSSPATQARDTSRPRLLAEGGSRGQRLSHNEAKLIATLDASR